MQRKLVKPRMITAPTSHLVHAFLILFLTLLCPIAIIMVPLVLLQCCFWVTHIQSGAWISVSKTCTQFHGYDPSSIITPTSPFAGGNLWAAKWRKRVSVEERSYLRRKKKWNLPLPVSMFLSLLYIFQTHSPVPRKYSTSTVIHRMTPKGPEMVCSCEPVSLTQREWRMVKGRQSFKYPLP